MTANLAALRPSSTSSAPAIEHPLIALAPQLRTLSLTDLAFRSFPSTALVALLDRAPLLQGVSLPTATLVGDSDVADALAAHPGLVALRLAPKHPRRPARSSMPSSTGASAAARAAGWRDAAFDLVAQAVPAARAGAAAIGGPAPREAAAGLISAEAGAAPAMPDDEHERDRVNEALSVALEVLEQVGRGGTVTLPAVDLGEEWTARAVNGEDGAAAGLRVVVEREGCVSAADGPWRIDAARWRERLELL